MFKQRFYLDAQTDYVLSFKVYGYASSSELTNSVFYTKFNNKITYDLNAIEHDGLAGVAQASAYNVRCNVNTNTGKWINVSIPFSSNDATATDITIYNYRTIGKFYFDDFKVVKAGEEPVEPEAPVEPEEPENIAEGTIGTINWVVTADGVLTVSGEGAIPAYTKNANAPWTAYAKQITKIVVANGVTEIGNFAFYKLASATSIEVADSVAAVGQLFLRDSGITEIALLGVKTVALNAFGSATKLTTVIFSDKAVDFKGNIFNNQTVTVKAPASSYADKYVELYGDRYSGNVTFESDGTTASNPVVRFAFAGDSAFFAIFENAKGNWALEISGAGKMKNFPYVCQKNIDKGFTFSPMYYIGEVEDKIDGVEPEAKILSIKVAEGITTIGNYIFHQCTKATTLTLPEGITSIGQGAFRNCQRLKTITLPEAVTKIEKTAFVSCSGLTEIYIPEGVVEVGTGIFEKCKPANITVKTKSAAAIAVIEAEYPTVTIVTEF